MQFADNAGPDQPAHKRRLIRAFIVRLQNQQILQYMSKNRECSDQTAQIFLFFFLFWVLRPFQEYFTYIEPIIHQRWATEEPEEKPPDHP